MPAGSVGADPETSVRGWSDFTPAPRAARVAGHARGNCYRRCARPRLGGHLDGARSAHDRRCGDGGADDSGRAAGSQELRPIAVGEWPQCRAAACPAFEPLASPGRMLDRSVDRPFEHDGESGGIRRRARPGQGIRRRLSRSGEPRLVVVVCLAARRALPRHSTGRARTRISTPRLRGASLPVSAAKPLIRRACCSRSGCRACNAPVKKRIARSRLYLPRRPPRVRRRACASPATANSSAVDSPTDRRASTASRPRAGSRSR